MKRLILENNPDGIYTALTVDGNLREIYIDKPNDSSLVGQIILGRLEVVLPGQLAFVNIGQNKNALMNVSKKTILTKNQPVLVQVYKDPTGSKGAYVGTELRHKGHLVILIENQRRDIGVSQKITDDKERKRLRDIVQQSLPKGFSIIVRTNAKNQEAGKIIKEIDELCSLHIQIKNKSKHVVFPALIHPDVVSINIPEILFDLVSTDIDEVVINGFDFDVVKKAIVKKELMLENRIIGHQESDCLIKKYNILPQILGALKKNVQLPCGGFITIEQTEACVVIDVNTGRYTGKVDFRTTALKTNIEAAVCIAKQLTLRNLSGIIIIDFIDMKHDQDKVDLLDTLSKEVKQDRIKTEIVSMTELGLVQLTRRRTREPLARLIEKDCSTCGGKGRVQI